MTPTPRSTWPAAWPTTAPSSLQSSYNDDTDELNTGSGFLHQRRRRHHPRSTRAAAPGVIAGTLVDARHRRCRRPARLSAPPRRSTSEHRPVEHRRADVTVTGTSFPNGAGGVVSGGTLNTSGVRPVNDTGGTVQSDWRGRSTLNSGFVSSGTLGVGTWLVGPASTLTISGVSSISTLSSMSPLGLRRDLQRHFQLVEDHCRRPA